MKWLTEREEPWAKWERNVNTYLYTIYSSSEIYFFFSLWSSAYHLAIIYLGAKLLLAHTHARVHARIHFSQSDTNEPTLSISPPIYTFKEKKIHMVCGFFKFQWYDSLGEERCHSHLISIPFIYRWMRPSHFVFTFISDLSFLSSFWLHSHS